MNIETAEKIYGGEIIPTEFDDYSVGELIQIALGGCLLDDGNIVCLECGLFNECCECSRENEDE